MCCKESDLPYLLIRFLHDDISLRLCNKYTYYAYRVTGNYEKIGWTIKRSKWKSEILSIVIYDNLLFR